jgi:outer membrane protein OmpA-like peptidoglycan-associated protein
VPSNDRATIRAATVIGAILGWASSATTSASPLVPLCPGLTIVTAISQRDGDYESIKTIESVDAKSVALKYSSEFREGGSIRRVTVRRTLASVDLATATLYMHHFHNKASATIPGTTAIGTSTAVLRMLKTKGEAELGIFDRAGAFAPADRTQHPNVYDHQMVETIRRVENGPVMLPITVNDAAVQLPAIHARGDYYGDKADFYFLDDEANPITLKFRIGRDTLDVVKINFQCDPRASAQMSRIERALLETGRADIYSIYFSFNSDQIRDESEPTLDDVAQILRRHPDWKLSVQGHTDSIAGDAYNLQLSERRAAAVKTALVSTKGIAATRLVTRGFGEGRPKDRNDTLEGRARNRRVEVVRVP